MKFIKKTKILKLFLIFSIFLMVFFIGNTSNKNSTKTNTQNIEKELQVYRYLLQKRHTIWRPEKKIIVGTNKIISGGYEFQLEVPIRKQLEQSIKLKSAKFKYKGEETTINLTKVYKIPFIKVSEDKKTNFNIVDKPNYFKIKSLFKSIGYKINNEVEFKKLNTEYYFYYQGYNFFIKGNIVDKKLDDYDKTIKIYKIVEKTTNKNYLLNINGIFNISFDFKDNITTSNKQTYRNNNSLKTKSEGIKIIYPENFKKEVINFVKKNIENKKINIKTINITNKWFKNGNYKFYFSKSEKIIKINKVEKLNSSNVVSNTWDFKNDTIEKFVNGFITKEKVEYILTINEAKEIISIKQSKRLKELCLKYEFIDILNLQKINAPIRISNHIDIKRVFEWNNYKIHFSTNGWNNCYGLDDCAEKNKEQKIKITNVEKEIEGESISVDISDKNLTLKVSGSKEVVEFQIQGDLELPNINKFLTKKSILEYDAYHQLYILFKNQELKNNIKWSNKNTHFNFGEYKFYLKTTSNNNNYSINSAELYDIKTSLATGISITKDTKRITISDSFANKLENIYKKQSFIFYIYNNIYKKYKRQIIFKLDASSYIEFDNKYKVYIPSNYKKFLHKTKKEWIEYLSIDKIEEYNKNQQNRYRRSVGESTSTNLLPIDLGYSLSGQLNQAKTEFKTLQFKLAPPITSYFDSSKEKFISKFNEFIENNKTISKDKWKSNSKKIIKDKDYEYIFNDKKYLKEIKNTKSNRSFLILKIDSKVSYKYDDKLNKIIKITKKSPINLNTIIILTGSSIVVLLILIVVYFLKKNQAKKKS